MRVMLTAFIVVFAGCNAAPSPQTTTPATTSTTTNDATTKLNSLDPRTPLPLTSMMALHQKQSMQAHLVAIHGIVDALATSDWGGVETAVKAIESSPRMKMMCGHMGAGAEGFTELALSFHTAADTIGEAARKRDLPATLMATSKTIAVCTDCHNQFRQEVLTESDWQAATNSEAPMQH